MASVTSEKRSRAARKAANAASGARWTWSTIACTVTPGRMSAAPATPGSRGGPAAVGVVEVGDRASAAVERGVGGDGVGVGVTDRDDDAAGGERLDEVEAARSSSGAKVIIWTGPDSHSASASATSGSRSCAGSCAPGHSGERYGPSRCTPSTARARRSGARGRGHRLGHGGQRRGIVAHRRRDERRQVAGDARGRQRRAGRA